MSNSGLKTIISVNFSIGYYKQQIRKSHFRRETANENKQFKKPKTLTSHNELDVYIFSWLLFTLDKTELSGTFPSLQESHLKLQFKGTACEKK